MKKTVNDLKNQGQRSLDTDRAYKVLVADLVGLKFDADGKPDPSAVKQHIESKGGVFHYGTMTSEADLDAGKIHFFYQPDLSREDELLAQTAQGQYDATIVAATYLPAASVFNEGGVRIGAGTGNMGSDSWGGGNGDGGVAPLMNTPSFNSRATAQMAMKALLKVMPDLPVQVMHDKVVEGIFDTGKDLCNYPTEKLEGKRMAVIGYGNIGREVAKLAQAFGMEVSIYARPAHQEWIESEGFLYAATPVEAATGADVISPHTGLGALNDGIFANANLVNSDVLNVMNDGAIVVNYDRGEVIDPEGLEAALSNGKVRYACIDADLFVNPDSGELTGPMVPYLSIQKKHADKMELLPHAAADTDHVSRVEGAKQAVDQIFSCIQDKTVVNLKGDLPEGFTDGGSKTVNGVGKVTIQNVADIADSEDVVMQMRIMAEQMAAFWGAVEATKDPLRRQILLDRDSAEVVKNSNGYSQKMAQFGAKGPFGA